MKKAEQLRLETNKLEEKIKLAVEEFIEEVGHCDIRIDSEIRLVQSINGEIEMVSTGVRRVYGRKL